MSMLNASNIAAAMPQGGAGVSDPDHDGDNDAMVVCPSC